MGSISDNVKYILDSVAEAAVKAGRKPEDIAVVAASKMNSAERVREAIAAGIKICGENRVQEMEEKLKEGAYSGAELHFIGHLQRNKVKNVTGKCALIQSVDSGELMGLISKRASGLGIVQDVLIEVNVGDEDSKSGVQVFRAEELAAKAADFPGLRVKGLMCIPPFDADAKKTQNYFQTMYNLFIDIKAKKYDNVSMNILSMGMSGDFRQAIAEGADMVRVGTGIFGMRQYHK
ncbi:MAG: YggS family pyridoxal phosphate-dependent enzyme [Oscillospiraceae bacterium]|nr:YggS family pyridoxal phosphate-dependent enzyme [Oscillospiraceae bacterium]